MRVGMLLSGGVPKARGSNAFGKGQTRRTKNITGPLDRLVLHHDISWANIQALDPQSASWSKVEASKVVFSIYSLKNQKNMNQSKQHERQTIKIPPV